MKPWQGPALAGSLFLFQAPAGAADFVQFEELDRNGDHRLSNRETRRVEGFDFAVADRDRDGFISVQEFEFAVRRTMNADSAERSSAPLSEIRHFSVADTNSACCTRYSG